MNECGADRVAMAEVFELSNLEHRLENRATGERFTVIVDRELKFLSRDFVGLLGPSGCGKTTLLTILGLLRSPSDISKVGTFKIFVPNKEGSDRKQIDIKELWRAKRQRSIESIRREHIGFSLQSGELISSLTVAENISVPLKLNRWRGDSVSTRVRELITAFSLIRGSSSSKEVVSRAQSVSESRINRLSGGEYQRVALARAIAHRPSVVFVDEPTSALNRELAYDALRTLQENQRSQPMAGVTFMITHDETLASEFCNVIVRMAPAKNRPAGEVVEVARNER